MEKLNFLNSETSTLAVSSKTKESLNETPKPITEIELQTWMISYLAELLEIDSDDIDINIPFDSYGLDSEVAVGMTGDLENWLEKELDPTLLYNYPTIKTFTKHLAEEFKDIE